MYNYKHTSSVDLFDDDTNVLLDGSSYDNMIDILNNELKHIGEWLKANN